MLRNVTLRACTLLGRARSIGLGIGLLMAPASARAADPPCAAFWQADAVFVGKAVDGHSGHAGTSQVQLAVVQVLRGTIDSRVTIVPAGSSCDYKFQAGQQYLIYAKRTPDGRWTTTTCAGTKPLEQAAEDLEFAESRQFARPVGQVFGTVQRIIARPDRRQSISKPAVGLTVSLANADSRFEATTDRDGKFDVTVPPGEYVITPEAAQNAHEGPSRRVSVPARGCAPVNIDLLNEDSRPLELTERVR